MESVQQLKVGGGRGGVQMSPVVNTSKLHPILFTHNLSHQGMHHCLFSVMFVSVENAFKIKAKVRRTSDNQHSVLRTPL